VGEDPPPTVAVKVTGVPAQILPDALDVMLTVGVEDVVIEIVIGFEVTVVAVGH
jgi:hypothetical protein